MFYSLIVCLPFIGQSQSAVQLFFFVSESLNERAPVCFRDFLCNGTRSSLNDDKLFLSSPQSLSYQIMYENTCTLVIVIRKLIWVSPGWSGGDVIGDRGPLFEQRAGWKFASLWYAKYPRGPHRHTTPQQPRASGAGITIVEAFGDLP